MYINKNFVLCFDTYRVLISLIVAAIVFYLNEVVFYKESISTIINLIIFISLIILFFISNIYGFFSLIFITLVLNTRPRELHLISLSERGNFEYFSINIKKLGPFVMTTDLMLIFIFVVLVTILFKKKLHDLKFLLPIGIYFLIGVFSTYIYLYSTKEIFIVKILQDLRFIILLVGGFLIAQSIYIKNGKNTVFIFINFLLFLFLVNVFLTIFNFSFDYLESNYKLQYSINTFYIWFIMFFILTQKKNNNFVFLLFSIVSFFLLIPFTRGEQLNLFILIILGFIVLAKQKEKLFLFHFLFYASIFIITVSIISYIQENFSSLYNYFLSKLMFFIEGSNVDHSSGTRMNELYSILKVDNLFDYYKLLFGKGFGGYYSFEGDVSLNLDLADYTYDEITNNTFFQPHMFIFYFFLKTGIIGTIAIVYFFLKNIHLKLDVNLFREKAIINKIYIFSFFTLLYNSYWVPYISMLAGFILYLVMKINVEKEY